MIPRALRRDAGFALAVILVAVYFVVGVIWRRARAGEGVLSHDIYAYSHPMLVYAQEAWQRGEGLLWNDFQNCGQPFFGIISTALLYPVNTVFLSGDVDLWLYSQALFHLSIAGLGMYLLCREIGLERVPAFAGALAFQLGGICRMAAVWSPAVLGPYAWLPLALLCCERILRTPRPALGVGLGLVLTLQLLAGLPLIPIFTYQLIALRVLWEILTRRDWPRARVISVLALGLSLPLLLAAVQLLPAIEMARESVRSIDLTAREIHTDQSSWDGFRHRVARRYAGPGSLFSAVGVVLAGSAFISRRMRRLAWFYFLVGALYFVLVFDNPLQALYRQLPIGSTFRNPVRFTWPASLAFSVLIACGVDAVTRPAVRSLRHWAPILAPPVAAIVAFLLFSRSGLLKWEWLLVAGTLASCGFTVLRGWDSSGARVLPVLLLACNLFAFAPRVYHSYAMDGSVLHGKSDVFAFLGERLSEQYRTYQSGSRGDYSLMSKSSSVFRIPGVDDYEHLTSRRYAQLYVKMVRGRSIKTPMAWIGHAAFLPTNHSILNLLAVRFLAIDESRLPLLIPLESIRRVGTVQIFENPKALPRASYVPMAQVEPDAEILLGTLASPRHQPRRAVLIEEPPADGFLGVGPEGRGEVRIVTGRGEEVVIRVNASQEGFLVLTDQYAPGWEATVNGSPSAIHRANYAFRMVRVPRGESTVAFRYRPMSVGVGAAISLVAWLAVGSYAAIGAARWQWWQRLENR